MTNYVRAAYHLYSLLRHVYWPRKKLERHQEKMLRRVVAYAYDHVTFYHRKFREIGIKPTDIETARDLSKLPILRKEEVKKNIGEMVSEEVDVKDLLKLLTSGSTGRPLNLYVSHAEDEFRKAKHLRANISCGQKPWDRWVVITSPTRFEMIGKFQRTLNVYAPRFVSVFDDVSKLLSYIKATRPTVLDGYSSSITLLAKEIEKREVDRDTRLKMIFTGAELLTSFPRRLIEKVFNCPLYDQYATIEFERMAWQCPEKAGYHIDADAIIMQFIDKNGEEVAEGERGEIVCTSLFNYAMPLIRYSVGDIGVPTDEECSCGRTLPLMKVVEGRKDSIIVLSDGRLLSPMTLNIAIDLFKLIQHIDQFRVIQEKVDVIQVHIKKKDDDVDEETMKKELMAHLRSVLNLGACEAMLEVKFVDDIPLDKSGKLNAVVSELRMEP